MRYRTVVCLHICTEDLSEAFMNSTSLYAGTQDKRGKIHARETKEVMAISLIFHYTNS